jgi:integrase
VRKVMPPRQVAHTANPVSRTGPVVARGASIFGLRHGCGYALANAGHDTRPLQAWLGHKNIQHTELTPDRLKDFWRCRGALPLIGARLPSWN